VRVLADAWSHRMLVRIPVWVRVQRSALLPVRMCNSQHGHQRACAACRHLQGCHPLQAERGKCPIKLFKGRESSHFRGYSGELLCESMGEYMRVWEMVLAHVSAFLVALSPEWPSFEVLTGGTVLVWMLLQALMFDSCLCGLLPVPSM